MACHELSRVGSGNNSSVKHHNKSMVSANIATRRTGIPLVVSANYLGSLGLGELPPTASVMNSSRRAMSSLGLMV